MVKTDCITYFVVYAIFIQSILFQFFGQEFYHSLLVSSDSELDKQALNNEHHFTNVYELLDYAFI